MPEDRLFMILLIAVSPAVGSFLGVLIDRLPRGQSVVYPCSACRSCEALLTARDLIPVLSFAARGGRCRHCGATIAPWLLYTEIAAVGAAVIAVILGATLPQMLLIACILWLLWSLALCDLLHFRLPDVLTATLLSAALIWSWLLGHDALTTAVGAILGAGSFWLVRVGYRTFRGREGLGLGDVKLMAGLGALLGPWDLPLLVLIAALAGLFAAVLRGGWRASRALPFGAALSASAAALWLWALVPN